MTEKKENSFNSILFNILIPVIILNKGYKWFQLDPKWVVVLALSFPLFFTIKDLVIQRKLNFISILGLLNVLVSGTLTLLALGGIWFAIKEAAFPLLIGVFVLGSSWSTKPFFKTLFMNPTTFNLEKVDQELNTEDKKAAFNQLMKVATLYLSLSFLMSSILNFVLALAIFKPLSETLSAVEKQQLLNEQLSQMTLYSLLVILVPSMIFLATLMFFTFKKINQITGLTTEDLLVK